MANLPGTWDAIVKKEEARAMDDNRDKLNPMTINLVVANVCKYLNLRELKVCRSVNQQWKKEVEKYFLRCWPPLKLSNEDSTVGISFSQFIEIYTDPNHTHPNADIYRRYQKFFVRNLQTEEHVQEFYDFLSKVGQKMTSLELRNTLICRDSQDIYDLLTSKYTPKLEDLSLNNVRVIGTLDSPENTPKDFMYKHSDLLKNKNLRRLHISSYDWEYQNVPWLNILSIYPNLKELGISQLPIYDHEEIATALVTLRQDDDKKLRLTKLDWSLPDNFNPDFTWERSFKILEAAHLPLEDLELFEIDDQDVFVHFLNAHKETLKTLEIFFELPHPFPLLGFLEHIKARIFSEVDLRFLLRVPNLKSLKLEDSHETVIFPDGIPTPIESFQVFDDLFGLWSVTNLNQLFEWLPNIQVLKMDLDNDTFSCVCEKLSNLRELTVRGNLLEDSAVIGESSKIEGENEVEERRHGITNLRELEKFKMYGRKPKLTKKSVLQAFALMPKLKSLEIGVAENLNFDARLALKMRIQTVKVKWNKRQLLI